MSGVILMPSIIQIYVEKMATKDNDFFDLLGQRVAHLRKASNLTQVQLSKLLGISQQHMGSFENGIRKIPASMLPKLAEIFAVPVDELLGIENTAAKRGPIPKLQQQIEKISALPKTKQRFVMEMLDTVINNK